MLERKTVENKSEELRLALERIDADSWEELCGAVPADIAEKLQLTVRREGGAVFSRCVVSDSPLSNRTVALGMHELGRRDQVFALVEHYRSCGLLNFALQISPYAGPAELERWLAEAGLAVRNRGVKLVRGDKPPLALPDRVEVRLLSIADKEEFGAVSARGFGRPPIVAHFMAATVAYPRWRHYLATIDGQAAGAATMYIDGKYAWLGMGSTLPDFRRQGVQQALIARRLADGLELGVRYFITETESVNTSCNNMMRLGFELAYERANYSPKLPSAGA